ncbi:alpha/beta hydrolase [Phytopseudomonas flavescens]|nr:alpha/beta hydrolase [Pseudomonas flavescens]
MRVIVLLLSTTAIAMGKPDLSRPLGPTLAERGSAFYEFARQDMTSADGQRHYRIWIAKPKRAAPATGYPVLYLLDGNAALGALQEKQLADLDERGPPLLVFVGYATDLRFDVNARAYDYTPPLPGGAPVIDDIVRQRRGGGADVFVDFLEQEVKPLVSRHAEVDPQRQSLWGHSYAGLLVLHTLFSRPQAFQRYIAADPSLWWQNGFILAEAKAFDAPPTPLSLVLLVGAGKPSGGVSGVKEDATVRARREAVAALPADAAEQLARRLAGLSGVEVGYRVFPDLSHGPMLPASLGLALRLSVGDDSEVERFPLRP